MDDIKTESSSMFSLDGLTKPATVLVEKVSDAVGGIFRPQQIVRVAEAEATASIIQAKANIEISDLQRRAFTRVLVEEAQKQQNIEDITQKALPNLSASARPEDVEKDWIANFFDKSRLVSDNEMQELWAQVLAGEANQPGSCSKRSINLLSSIDKKEAELFKSFCTYVWTIGDLTPVIYDLKDTVYAESGLTFDSLQRLQLAGLIHFSGVGDYEKIAISPQLIVFYYGDPYMLTLPLFDNAYKLGVGKALLTDPGKELAKVSGSVPNAVFRDYVLEKWKDYCVTPLQFSQPKV